ncbi:MAG TPA: hypothetical protein PLD27_05550 [bacterium]|nr:hypothetical protein [bacterium]HOL47832.1 hypothetical protein [bacterium]HPQ19545.1 hypothetical protein [bacterium]
MKSDIISILFLLIVLAIITKIAMISINVRIIGIMIFVTIGLLLFAFFNK